MLLRKLPSCVPFTLTMALAGYFAASPQEADRKGQEKVPAAKERLTLKGHSVMVWAAAFSPDGKTLASAAGLYDKPGEMVLWNAATGRLQAKADEPKGIRALAFSQMGRDWPPPITTATRSRSAILPH